MQRVSKSHFSFYFRNRVWPIGCCDIASKSHASQKTPRALGCGVSHAGLELKGCQKIESMPLWTHRLKTTRPSSPTIEPGSRPSAAGAQARKAAAPSERAALARGGPSAAAGASQSARRAPRGGPRSNKTSRPAAPSTCSSKPCRRPARERGHHATHARRHDKHERACVLQPKL